jgi:hypothetical protein
VHLYESAQLEDLIAPHIQHVLADIQVGVHDVASMTASALLQLRGGTPAPCLTCPCPGPSPPPPPAAPAHLAQLPK